MGFLTNLVKVFPSLATRPLHVTGESYAGTYIVRYVCIYAHNPLPILFSALHHESILRLREATREHS